jgi:hypothetical protein
MVDRKGLASMGYRSFLASIHSEDLRKVAKHWNEVRAARPMAAWHDIRPSAIAAQLTSVWVYRYDRETDTFTGRLAGDLIEQMLGKSFHGTPMREIYPAADYPRLFARAKRVTCEPALDHGHGTVFRHVDRYGEGERIMMPLGDDGIHGDGVLGATVYDFHRGTPNDVAAETETWFPLV